MFRAFIRLAIGLAREPEFHQLFAHRVGADRMSHLSQGRRELLHALRHPDQGPHRIAQRRRRDQALKCGDKPRIGFTNRATPAPGAANPPFRQRFGVEIIRAAIDRRTGEPGDSRHHRETAPTSRPHLARRKQSPATLIELAADRLPSLPNGVLVDHPTDLRLFAPRRNPQTRVIPTHDDGLRFSYFPECP